MIEDSMPRYRGMRKSNLFLFFMFVNMVLLAMLFVHALTEEKRNLSVLEEKRAMVEKHRLTDLCLFTEASYTRHLAVSDRHTAFQDGPFALEHFPSGSVLSPPGRRKR
jgi:hypothetical protein